MAIDLFAGIPVNDYGAALTWYERLLGSPPAFLPNDIKAVWELAEHRYVVIEQRPEHAGHAMHTVFVDDCDARIAQIADRGLEPTKRESYSNGVRKAIYRDPDGERDRVRLFATGRSPSQGRPRAGRRPAERQPLARPLTSGRAGGALQRRPTGSAPRLSQAHLAAIDQALREGARSSGFDTDHWTLPRLPR